MILVQIQQINTAKVLLKSASTLAIQLQKPFGVLSFVDADDLVSDREKELKEILKDLNISGSQITARNSKINTQ